MASKSHVHASRTSPIPGIVVIVLAVGAILFGLAVVRAPQSANDSLRAEVTGLRSLLAATDDERAALASKVDELILSRSATQAALEALQLRIAALEQGPPAK